MTMRDASGRTDIRQMAAAGDVIGLLETLKAKARSGDSTVVLGSLVGCLQDDDRIVQSAAATALGEWGDPACLDALFAVAANASTSRPYSPEDYVYQPDRGAKGAIEKLAKRAPDAVAEKCRAVLGLHESRLRQFAAEMAGKLKDTNAVEFLIAALDDAEETGGYSSYGGRHPGWHTTYDLRAAAALALGKIGDRRATQPLVRVLRDVARDPKEREAAAEALADLRDERAFEALSEALYDEDVSWPALRALRELDSPEAKAFLPVAEVIGALERGSESVDVVKAAAELADPRCTLSLVRFLERLAPQIVSPTPSVEWGDAEVQQERRKSFGLALNTLRHLGGEQADRAIEQYGSAPYVRMLNTATRDESEREAAARALVGLPDESTMDAVCEALFEALHDEDLSSRALQALVDLRSPRAKELLPVAEVIAALERSGSVDTCREAVKAASTLGDPRCTRALIHTLEWWSPKLTAPAAGQGDADKRRMLGIRVMVRQVLATLRGLGGDEAERAIEKYGVMLDEHADAQADKKERPS